MNLIDSMFSFIASKIETIPLVDGGVVNAGTINAGTYVDIPITFTKSFKSPPNVSAVFEGNSTGAGCGNMACFVKYQTVDADGFEVRIYNNDSANRAPAVRWLAVGV